MAEVRSNQVGRGRVYALCYLTIGRCRLDPVCSLRGGGGMRKVERFLELTPSQHRVSFSVMLMLMLRGTGGCPCRVKVYQQLQSTLVFLFVALLAAGYAIVQHN